MKIVPIVEGHGDCEAVPVLLRRLVVAAGHHAEIVRPIRIPKSKLLKEAELRRAVQMAAKHAGADDAILVLLDADADCPATLGPQLRAWARDERKDRRITVVLAQREFEAWFIAATTSLIDARKLPQGTMPPRVPRVDLGRQGLAVIGDGSPLQRNDRPARLCRDLRSGSRGDMRVLRQAAARRADDAARLG